MKASREIVLIFVLLLMAAVGPQVQAQNDSGLLTLDSFFSYSAQSLNEVEWQQDGSGYLALEPSPNKPNAVDVVRYDAATGAKSILVSADKLIRPGDNTPLFIEQFDFSPDGQKLLIYTNSERVWRSNTRGD